MRLRQAMLLQTCDLGIELWRWHRFKVKVKLCRLFGGAKSNCFPRSGDAVWIDDDALERRTCTELHHQRQQQPQRQQRSVIITTFISNDGQTRHSSTPGCSIRCHGMHAPQRLDHTEVSDLPRREQVLLEPYAPSFPFLPRAKDELPTSITVPPLTSP